MGGGVGGMVYSIQNGDIICSHANHRGDVIARSSDTGSLTYFALYEAYGTRPYEWGSDPDRQKANTKEEESDLGLLNEGMRYRDLETGTFLTRDPIGYADGPNVYCYVHCNPITRFDAWGLSEEDGEKVIVAVVDDLDTGDSIWAAGVNGTGMLESIAHNKNIKHVIKLSVLQSMVDNGKASTVKEALNKRLSDVVSKTGSKIDQIHFVDHGGPGKQWMGENGHDELTKSVDLVYAGSLMKDEGTIYLYGCYVGRDTYDGTEIPTLSTKKPEGSKYIQRLANLSGRNVIGYTGKTRCPKWRVPNHEGDPVERSPEKLQYRKRGDYWYRGSGDTYVRLPDDYKQILGEAEKILPIARINPLASSALPSGNDNSEE